MRKRWRSRMWWASMTPRIERSAVCDLTWMDRVRSQSFWKLCALLAIIKWGVVLLAWLACSLWTTLAQAEVAPTAAAPAKTVVHQPAAAPEDEGLVEVKAVTGELTMIRRNAISVEFSKKDGESFEMLLPLADEVQFEHVKSLAELKRGDQVRVKYRQRYRDDEHGGHIVLKTQATTIELLKRASDALSSQGAAK